jgi:hypothetical protein
MSKCPCCSSQLLRHARHSGIYWFCSYCWQEMPNFSTQILTAKIDRQQAQKIPAWRLSEK